MKQDTPISLRGSTKLEAGTSYRLTVTGDESAGGGPGPVGESWYRVKAVLKSNTERPAGLRKSAFLWATRNKAYCRQEDLDHGIAYSWHPESGEQASKMHRVDDDGAAGIAETFVTHLTFDLYFFGAAAAGNAVADLQYEDVNTFGFYAILRDRDVECETCRTLPRIEEVAFFKHYTAHNDSLEGP
eukprot:m.381792 g.381792  ORF g.381792 m.381792 type:complete len:186 (-) comp16717_c0_seq5:1732-2289(-)